MTPPAELRTVADPTDAAPPQPPGESDEDRKRRELRERAKERRAAAKRKREAAAARRAARRSDEPEAPAAEASDEGDEPTRSDEDRRRDASRFLRLLFRLVALPVLLFGFNLEPLSAAEAYEDADAWVPIARRYKWLDVTITWAAAPVAFVERIAQKARRRPPKEKAPEKAP